MINKRKKGFTLVEMLVVIAILAILATVGIFGYSRYIKKANISNDQSLISQWNTLIKAHITESDDFHTTNDVVAYLYNEGYIVDKISTQTKGYFFAYDVVNKSFALVSDQAKVVFPEGDFNPYDLFIIADEVTILEDSVYAGDNEAFKDYSLYLGIESILDEDVDIVTNKGIDTGNYAISSILYKNSVDQNVVIRTSSANTSLTIEDSSNSEITQYGDLGNLIVNECAMNSLTICGNIAYVEAKAGHIVIGKGGEVELIYKNSNSATDVMVETKEDGVVHHAHAKNSEIAENKDSENNTLNVVFDHDYVNIISDTTVNHESGEYSTSGGWTIEKGKEKVVADAKRKEVINKYKDAKTWIECVDVNYSFANGSGTVLDPYQISNPTDLAFIAYMTNKGDEHYASAYYKLTSDLSLSEKGWYPIGTFQYPFHGHIDGNNKTIDGLTGTDDSMIAQNWFTSSVLQVTGAAFGLVGIAGNGELEVSNIDFTNVDINMMSGNCVGTVLGYAPSDIDFNGDKDNSAKASGVGKGNTSCTKITIENISVSGNINVLHDAASIAGKIYADKGFTTINNCTNNANITVAGKDGDTGRVAGIVSFFKIWTTESSLTMTGNVNNGIIKGINEVSGILNGQLHNNLTIKDNINNGKIEFNENADSLKVASIYYLQFVGTTNISITNNKNTYKGLGIDSKVILCCEILKNESKKLNANITSSVFNYGNLTIKGGSYPYITNKEGAKLTITAGTVTRITNPEGCTTTITGGSFEFNPCNYVDLTKYYVICNEDNLFEVHSGLFSDSYSESDFEAKVNFTKNDISYDIYFKNIEKAFEIGSPTLLKDISADLVASKSGKSINLNGHTFTGSIAAENEGYSLTIKGQRTGDNIGGTAVLSSISLPKGSLSISYCSVTINSGTIKDINVKAASSTVNSMLIVNNSALAGTSVTLGNKNSSLTVNGVKTSGNSNDTTPIIIKYK